LSSAAPGQPKPTLRRAEIRRFLGQVGALITVLRVSRERNVIIGMALGIAVVVVLTAVGQVYLNTWQGGFYDALARRDLMQFTRELGVFAGIVAALVVLGVLQAWFREMLKIRLREGLTRDLLDQWLRPRAAFRLAAVGEIGVNPDQRLQEDTRHLTELTADLGIGLFQASVLLVSFVDVLWELSDRVAIPFQGHPVIVPGYMVWCALAYAAAGSLITWYVGRPRIRFNAEHYAREAKLRFALVRLSEAAEGVALDNGEDAERRLIDRVFADVLEIMARLANNMAKLTWVTSSYGYIALVFPIAVASPGYFQGTLSFGALMMVVGAFNQVQGSLRWAVDNFPGIADWSATFLRVMNFYDALIDLDRRDVAGPHIAVLEHPEDRIEFRDLAIRIGGAMTGIREGDTLIRPGERVQILGPPGTGKALLFRIMAGLWSDGTGTVLLPSRDSMMFLPQRPYLPPGTLAQVLAYPALPETYGEPALVAALDRVGLGRFQPSMERGEAWDREMSIAEQQALALVRVLLHRPRWLVMDEALGTLDEVAREKLLSILGADLPHTAVVSIDAIPLQIPFFTRTLHLAKRG
jgi:putative ATP-binding cassette transporter